MPGRVKVIWGVAGLLNDYAIEQGEPEFPEDIIEEILDERGKEEEWCSGKISIREIYVLAVELREKKATRH